MSPDTGVEVDTRLAFSASLKLWGMVASQSVTGIPLMVPLTSQRKSGADFSLPPGIRRACSMVSSVMFW